MNMVKLNSGIWRVDFDDAQGVRRRLSTKSRDGVAARQIAKDLIRKHDAELGVVAPSAPRGLTVAKLLDRCFAEVWNTSRSQATTKSNIKVLKSYIGDELVAEMDFTKLDKLKLKMLADNYAPGTVARKMTALGKALTMATRWTGANGRPLLSAKPSMPQVVVQNFCDRVINPAEQDAVFDAVAARVSAEPMRDWKRFGLLLVFLRDTGCRLSEALKLTVNNLKELEDPTRGTVTFAEFPRYSTKNKKPRNVPLSGAIMAEMPYLKAAAVDGFLFPYKPQTAWYSFNTIRADLKKKGIDLSDVKLHTWRHTCLTKLARSGKVRIEDIADWAGHASIQITMDRYRHMLPQDKLTILDVLNPQ